MLSLRWEPCGDPTISSECLVAILINLYKIFVKLDNFIVLRTTVTVTVLL
jgi:hypothetical protein